MDLGNLRFEKEFCLTVFLYVLNCISLAYFIFNDTKIISLIFRKICRCTRVKRESLHVSDLTMEVSLCNRASHVTEVYLLFILTIYFINIKFYVYFLTFICILAFLEYTY